MSELLDFIQQELMFELVPVAEEKFLKRYPNGEMTYDYKTDRAVFKVGLEEVIVDRNLLG